MKQKCIYTSNYSWLKNYYCEVSIVKLLLKIHTHVIIYV